MAAQVVVIKKLLHEILVIFNQPDGSTSCGNINYDILVKVDSPDGSTY